MKKYIIHYHTSSEALDQISNATSEEKAKSMKLWQEWKNKLGDKLVDFGSQIMGAYRLTSDGKESYDRSDITGYSIILANNPKEVESLIKTHPHLNWTDNCAIEIFECK